MSKFRGILIFFVLVVFVACGSEGGNGQDSYVPSGEGVPLMWHVTSPSGRTMYLFGSIHAADSRAYPLPDFVMDAFNRSDYLAVEVDLTAMPPLEDLLAINELMMAGPGRSIIDYIGFELHARAVRLMDRYRPAGWMPMTANGFGPAVWMSGLLSIVIEASGLTAEEGIDMFFINEANAMGMPILEAESMLSQMAMLAGFSPPLMLAVIEDAVIAAENLDEAAAQMLEMYDAWLRGDAEWMLALNAAGDYAFEMLGLDSTYIHEYNYGFLIARDREMTEVARGWMADGKQVFFVAGLFHFLHDYSIVHLLTQAGYDVQLVRP
ncbi:MAG: TraB/GumN family protein [Defluviitaleaceae bacterium]|nr:TraB/GumN family protein [Defluviitaleaceae bacterium]